MPVTNADAPAPGGPINLLDLVDELEPRTAGERKERLDRLGLSPEQRRQVENCLRFSDSATGFLERAPVGVQQLYDRPPTDTGGPAEPQVPGYEVVGRLGEGGMGTVWRAVQLGTRRQVALKLMHVSRLDLERAKVRFVREVQIASLLEDPHIARVYDSGVHQGTFYYAMELVEGTPLDQYVESAKLSRPRILELMQTVCRAVQHAHQNGVIHRDLKPGNILVTKDGRPKVLDFGLARLAMDNGAGADPTVTLEGDMAGTPAYMSPEQARGGVRLDTRSDVYSLGIILYRLLADSNPRDLTGTRLELLRRISDEEIRIHRRAALGPEVEAVLLKAMAREPDGRYATAAELATDLEHLLRGEPVSARPPTLLYVLGKGLRRNWPAVAAAVAVVVTIVSTGVYFYAREIRQRRVAEANERRAELTSAGSKIGEGDARLGAFEIADARRLYQDAFDILKRNRASTFAAEVAQAGSYYLSPPPLVRLSGHAAPVTCCAFLHGGREMVSGSEDGTVRLWENVTRRAAREFKGRGEVQGLAVSPDERSIAVARTGAPGRGLSVEVLATGERVLDVTGFQGEPVSVAFSPDGRLLLLGTTDDRENAYLFDAANGTLLHRLVGHTAAVRSAAFTPDGGTALTSSGRKPHGTEFFIDATVRAWDVADGHPRWSSPGDDNGRFVSDVAVSPDGSSVFTSGYQGTATVWDAANGKARHEFFTDRQIRGAAFSPDGALVATASEIAGVRVRWADTGEVICTFAGGERSVQFSPDGRFVAAADGNEVLVWPLFDHAATRHFVSAEQRWSLGAEPEELIAASFSSDGRLALSTSGAYERRSVTLWDVATGQQLARARRVTTETDEAGVHAGPGDVHDVLGAFLPDGRSVLMVMGDGTLGICDFNLAEPRRTLAKWGERRAAGVAVSPDGRHALARYWGSDTLQLYDVPSGRRCVELGMEGAVCVDRMVFSADSKLAAAASREGVVKVWDLPSGKVRYGWRTSRVNQIAFSSDGGLLACVGAQVSVFDTRQGTQVVARQYPSQLWSVSFVPHDDRLLLGSETRPIELWDMKTNASWRFSGTEGFCFDFAWDKHGENLLAAQASDWGFVLLLDLTYQKELTAFEMRLQSAADRLKQDPADGRALKVFGEYYAFRGAWPQAIELLGRAQAAGAAIPPGLMASCHWMSGEPPEECRAEFRAALAAAGDGGEAAHLRLCLAAVSDDDFDPAARCYQHPAVAHARRHVSQRRRKRAEQLLDAAAMTAGSPQACADMRVRLRRDLAVALAQKEE